MTFLFLVLVLLAIGLIMMFSASYPSAYSETGDSLSYLKRQLLYAVLGVGALKKFSYWILLLAILALIGVLLVPSATGVKRWIPLGPFSMQASEIAKLAVIIALAQWGTTHFKRMDTFLYGVMPPMIMFVVIALLLFLEPHYSGIVIIFLLVVLMMFVSGVKLRSEWW